MTIYSEELRQVEQVTCTIIMENVRFVRKICTGLTTWQSRTKTGRQY